MIKTGSFFHQSGAWTWRNSRIAPRWGLKRGTEEGAGGLMVVSYFINALCFYLSPVAVVIVCFYSLTKRFTDFTHIYLGISLALAPIGAWLAVKGADVSLLEILQMTLLALAVVLWLVTTLTVLWYLLPQAGSAAAAYSPPRNARQPGPGTFRRQDARDERGRAALARSSCEGRFS